MVGPDPENNLPAYLKLTFQLSPPMLWHWMPGPSSTSPPSCRIFFRGDGWVEMASSRWLAYPRSLQGRLVVWGGLKPGELADRLGLEKGAGAMNN